MPILPAAMSEVSHPMQTMMQNETWPEKPEKYKPGRKLTPFAEFLMTSDKKIKAFDSQITQLEDLAKLGDMRKNKQKI